MKTISKLFGRQRPAAPKVPLPAGQRIYAIGDIHGRLDLFDALVSQIKADSASRGAANVRIICIGDLVDRGPDSAKMVARAASWSDPESELEVLMGNHEHIMLAALKGDTRSAKLWLRHGGVETLASYGVAESIVDECEIEEVIEAVKEAVPHDHISWLTARPPSIHIEPYFFVHAGVRPGQALTEQKLEDLLWIDEAFLNSADDHGAIIVHGHTITSAIEVRRNRIGLDTGAYRSGTLSAVGLEADQHWVLST